MERGAVLEAIRTLQLQDDSMECFGARPTLPLQTCLEEVQASDIIVVIVGHRYGSVANGTDVSFAHAEYDEAFRLKKPILAYMRDDSVPVLVKHVERDPLKLQRLERWKSELVARHTVGSFRESSDLAAHVTEDLRRSIEQDRNVQGGVGVRESDPVLLSQSDAHDYLYEAVATLANSLVDTDDQITGLIAATNACGFYADDVEITEMGRFNFVEASMPFRARVQLTGEQDEDQMFSGDKIFLDIPGTLSFDGTSWEIDDYDIAAEAEDLSE